MKSYLFVLLAMVLSGCATFFHYVPAPGESAAKLKVGTPVPFVYLTPSAECPKLRLNQEVAVTVIPANRRLWIEPGYNTTGIPGGGECTVPMSFVATPDKEYVLVFQSGERSCLASVMTRDTSGKLVKEASMRDAPFKRCSY